MNSLIRGREVKKKPWDVINCRNPRIRYRYVKPVQGGERIFPGNKSGVDWVPWHVCWSLSWLVQVINHTLPAEEDPPWSLYIVTLTINIRLGLWSLKMLGCKIHILFIFFHIEILCFILIFEADFLHIVFILFKLFSLLLNIFARLKLTKIKEILLGRSVVHA